MLPFRHSGNQLNPRRLHVFQMSVLQQFVGNRKSEYTVLIHKSPGALTHPVHLWKIEHVLATHREVMWQQLAGAYDLQKNFGSDALVTVGGDGQPGIGYFPPKEIAVGELILELEFELAEE